MYTALYGSLSQEHWAGGESLLQFYIESPRTANWPVSPSSNFSSSVFSPSHLALCPLYTRVSRQCNLGIVPLVSPHCETAIPKEAERINLLFTNSCSRSMLNFEQFHSSFLDGLLLHIPYQSMCKKSVFKSYNTNVGPQGFADHYRGVLPSASSTKLPSFIVVFSSELLGSIKSKVQPTLVRSTMAIVAKFAMFGMKSKQFGSIAYNPHCLESHQLSLRMLR